MCNRHIALHLEPASRRPRIRPLEPGVGGAASSGTSALTRDVIPREASYPLPAHASGPAPTSLAGIEPGPASEPAIELSQAFAAEWDFEFDPGIQDWLHEILEGIPTDFITSPASLPVSRQLSRAAPDRVDVNHNILLGRLRDRLQVRYGSRWTRS